MGTQTSTIIMNLIDGISGPASEASASMKNLLDMSGDSRKGRMPGMFNSTVGEVAGLATGVLSFYKAAEIAKKGFLDQVDEDTTWRHIQQRTNATEEEIESAKVALEQLENAFAVPHKELVAGFAEMAQGGSTFKEIMATLPNAILANKGLGVDINKAAQAQFALNQQLGITQEQMPAAWEMIVQASHAGKVGVDALVEAIPHIGALAKISGLEGMEGFRQLLATIETIAPKFGSAEEAITAVTNVLAKMRQPDLQKIFDKEEGIDLIGDMQAAKAAGTNLVDFLVSEFKKLAPGGDMNRLPEILGRGYAEMIKALVALSEAGDGINAAQTKISGGGNEVTNRANKEIASTAAALIQLSNAWEAFGRETGKGLIDAGAIDVLKGFTNQIHLAINDWNTLLRDIRQIRGTGSPEENIAAAHERQDAAEARKAQDAPFYKTKDRWARDQDDEIAEQQKIIDSNEAVITKREDAAMAKKRGQQAEPIAAAPIPEAAAGGIPANLPRAGAVEASPIAPARRGQSGSWNEGGATGDWGEAGKSVPVPPINERAETAAPDVSAAPATLNERFGSFPIDNREGEARAAGERLGAAFRQGATPDLHGTVADVQSAIDKIISMMTFGASPSITPSAAGAGAGATGGLNANGIFSDSGIAPAR
jgi:TP901 family phage tail tape measure protein